MLSLAVCSANFITQLVVLVILAWGVCTYVRLRRQLWNIKRRIVNMELDDIIDDLLEADSGAVAKHDTTYQRRAGPETTHSVGGEDNGTTDTKYQQHRERLAALAAGGRARQYLGRHCPSTRSTIWKMRRSRSSTAATRLGLEQRWQKPWGQLRFSYTPPWPACFSQYPPKNSRSY